MPKHTMTAEEARQLFSYNPETGDLAWRISLNNRAPSGYVVGSNTNSGYLQTQVRGERYLAHRIAWLMTYGEWPKEHIDHINGDFRDNRLCNLRLATNAENRRNTKLNRRNKTGFKGVSFDKTRNKWTAHISVCRQQKNLGRFNTPEEAYVAYCKAAAELHGEFANFG